MQGDFDAGGDAEHMVSGKCANAALHQTPEAKLRFNLSRLNRRNQIA
jgi:hypothetical protein